MKYCIPTGRNAHIANVAVEAALYDGNSTYDFSPGDCVVDRFKGHRGIVQEVHGFRIRVQFENGRTGSLVKGALRPARATDSL